MGRKAKFEKLEKNESYYSVHTDEVSEKKGLFSGLLDSIKSKEKEIINLDPENVPEKRKVSSKFTYKKNIKKVEYTDSKKDEEVEKPEKEVFILAFCVLVLVFASKFLLGANEFMALSQKNYAIAEAVMSIAAFVLPCVCYLLSSKNRMHSHYLKKFSPSHIPFAGAMLGLVLSLTALQKYYIAYTFSYSAESYSASGDMLLVIFTGAVLPAVCEELFVHGVFQREVSKYAGGICGVIASAFIFALLHFELQYFLIYFVAGLIMGALTHITRSVFPAMIVHFLSNVFSVMFSERLSFIAVERIGGTLLMVVMAILSFIFLIICLRVAETITLRKAEKNVLFEKDEITVFADKGRSARRSMLVFTAPFMLACFALFIIAILFL